ncbi:hypothetical protein CVS40_7603 [Lucilia cuprina]|nr:hypothetical protein CVS40_7603 [Lucilia cuprina]
MRYKWLQVIIKRITLKVVKVLTPNLVNNSQPDKYYSENPIKILTIQMGLEAISTTITATILQTNLAPSDARKDKHLNF